MSDAVGMLLVQCINNLCALLGALAVWSKSSATVAPATPGAAGQPVTLDPTTTDPAIDSVFEIAKIFDAAMASALKDSTGAWAHIPAPTPASGAPAGTGVVGTTGRGQPTAGSLAQQLIAVLGSVAAATLTSAGGPLSMLAVSNTGASALLTALTSLLTATTSPATTTTTVPSSLLAGS